MNLLGRSLSILLVVCLLLSTAVSPTIADTSSSPLDPRTDHSSTVSLFPSNNTTVQQENPDSVNENGDAGNLEGWLATQLSSRLRQSSVELSQGEYDTARQLVGEEYRERYGQYVDVAGDVDEDTRAATSFEKAQQNQQTLVSSVQKYRTTYNQYQRAKQNGNAERTRELARELSQIATQINNSSTELRSNLGTVSNQTGTSFTEVNQSTTNVTQNVSQQQAQVIEETFVQTRLTASTNTTRTSFREPLTITGQVTTANRSAVNSSSARFRIQNQVIETPIRPNGSFTLSYRPTTVSLNASTVTVRYVPASTSIYLGSNDTVSVNISQVTPDVRVNAPQRASYNDSVTITGFVGTEEYGAANAPVTLSVNDTLLGVARTTANGSFALSASLPAEIPNGTQHVTARLPLRNQALATANATTPITIRETNTALSVTTNRSGEQIHVTGTFQTAAGSSIPNQSIAISVDGRSRATIETKADGSYAALVPFSAEQSEDGTTTIDVRFDGTGTNLASARAQTNADVPGTDTTGSGLLSRLQSVPWWIAVGGLAIIVCLGVMWRYIRRKTGVSNEPTVNSTGSKERTPESATAEAVAASQSLLAAARDQLSSGHIEQAIQTAYLATRMRLSTSVEGSHALTHWELYERCHEKGLADDKLEALRQVTEAYEQVTFAAQTVPSEKASRTLDAASTLR